MKHFICTGKNPDGSPFKGEIDAPSREAAVRIFRARGIIIVSVQGSALKPARGRVAGLSLRTLGWCSVLLILLVLLLYLFRAREKTTENLDGSGSRQERLARSSKKGKGSAHGRMAGAQKKSKGSKAAAAGGDADAAVVAQPPEGRHVPRAKAKLLPEMTAPKSAPPPKAFANGTEQLLAMVIPGAPGAEVPPLPQLAEESISEDLHKAMGEDIVVRTNDSEQVLWLKEGVASLKEEYRTLAGEEGVTFTSYLEALRNKYNEDAAALKAAQQEADALWSDPDVTDEDYVKRLNEINAGLKERGLAPLE